MKHYKIFKNQIGQIEAVKQGFSWPAFFFTWIWALVKKNWFLAIGILISGILLQGIFHAVTTSSFIYLDLIERFYNRDLFSSYFERDLNELINSYYLYFYNFLFWVVIVLYWVAIGLKGNAWRESNLLTRGYELMGTTIAANPNMAAHEFIQKEAVQRPTAATQYQENKFIDTDVVIPDFMKDDPRFKK